MGFLLFCIQGIFTEQQIRGFGGVAARYDRQRMGLEKQRKSRLEQSIEQSKGRVFRWEWELFRYGGKQARQILVPRVLPQCQGKKKKTSISTLTIFQEYKRKSNEL